MISAKEYRFFVLLGLLITVATKSSSQVVTSWLTNGDKSSLFEQQASVGFGAGVYSTKITVSDKTTYQTMDGFGYTMTEGSAEVISSLTAEKQELLLNELFNPTTGLGISVLRISIGASDLSNSSYSYNDVAGNTDMTKFSLSGPDLTYLIPVLKKALIINPNIKILATPWSAPKWMKTSKSWIGGSLMSSYYAAYSHYFIKYFDAMKAQGITIWAITPQNEPEHGGNEPSMLMTSAEQINFINNHLGPAMATAGYSAIKIIAFDHNCDNTAYPIEVCTKSTFVDGAAFHLYGGDISALTTFRNATGKNVYFTEQYTAANGDFSGDLSWHMNNVMLGSVKNWSKVALEWNLATNASFGPHTTGGCNSCLGAITINSSSNFTRNVSYYIVGHMSKVIKPGAVRIGSTTTNSGLSNAAFKNVDGTIGLVVINNSGSSKTFDVYYKGQAFPCTLKNAGVVSFIWTDSSQKLDEQTDTKKEVSIYPNPSKQYVTFANLEKDMTLNLFSSSGNLVIRKELYHAENENIVDLSRMEDGIYLAKLNNGYDSIVRKIIKN